LIEELFKSAPVLLGKNSRDVFIIGLVSSLSFGFGELFVGFAASGRLTLTFTPFFHVLFQVPMMYMYGRFLDGRSKGSLTKTWVLGYLIAFAFHALYNIAVLWLV
jgi:hypothetical protein